MRITIRRLIVRAKRSIESVDFSDTVTFIYGPISKGKSTTLRLIDFCLGGKLERTPAIQQEFISAELSLNIGNYTCKIERSATDNDSVRISWSNQNEEPQSIIAPLAASESRIIDNDVYNLSDLLFYLSGVTPIKVKKRSRDPESPLIRLSFRDIWWYSYLNQEDLDSSFFRFGHPFKERKSKDALKFFTGLYSERLANTENEYFQALDEQRSKRDAAKKIRHFMNKFEYGSEIDLIKHIESSKIELNIAKQELDTLKRQRKAQTHPTDTLRSKLRSLSEEIELFQIAILDLNESIEEQKSLRAELIMSKTKALRLGLANSILDRVHFARCPECGEHLPAHYTPDQCTLCGQTPSTKLHERDAQELEGARRDLNDRIDQIGESISGRRLELEKIHRSFEEKKQLKNTLDNQLQQELAQYDSAYIESTKHQERSIATLSERIQHLTQILKLATEIRNLEDDAEQMQSLIDAFRTSLKKERDALNHADENVSQIASEFKRILLTIKFPGVSEKDTISIDTRSWKPYIFHDEIEWSFWECGSGGKKTLFNACYALAIHIVAIENNLPVPSVLIIDSPTKNISEDEDPKLVQSLYSEIYRVAASYSNQMQIILVDSDLVTPDGKFNNITIRRMAGTPEEPSLISYYEGP